MGSPERCRACSRAEVPDYETIANHAKKVTAGLRTPPMTFDDTVTLHARLLTLVAQLEGYCPPCSAKAVLRRGSDLVVLRG